MSSAITGQHKTINAYGRRRPHGRRVQKYSVQRPLRTSFLLYVLVISIILFAPLTFAGVEPGWRRCCCVSSAPAHPRRCGISYEILRFSASHMDSRSARRDRPTNAAENDRASLTTAWSPAPSPPYSRCLPPTACWRQRPGARRQPGRVGRSRRRLNAANGSHSPAQRRPRLATPTRLRGARPLPRRRQFLIVAITTSPSCSLRPRRVDLA